MNLAAKDEDSKVLKTEYSLDGGKTWSLYVKPIDVSQFNGFAIQYRSTDRAGNMEIIQEQAIRVDGVTFKSILSDYKKVRY